MGKRSRDKGAAGEREFASVTREAGLDAERTAQLQAGERSEGSPDVTIYDYPELHVEVKRDERLSVDRMIVQAEEDSAKYRGGPRLPIVAWRRNGSGRKGWRIDAPARWVLGLLVELKNLRSEVAELRERLNVCPECGDGFDTYGPDWCRTHFEYPDHKSSPESTTTITEAS